MTLRLLFSLSLAAGLALPALSTAAPAADGWSLPQCRQVTGAPSITASPDQGQRLARTAGTMAPISYTLGLVPLEEPGVWMATVGAQVIRSADGGCTWAPWLDLTQATGGALLTLTRAPGDRVYAWADNGSRLSAIEGQRSRTVTLPGASIVGLAVDPANADHLRYGDSSGAVWDSTDGGTNWTRRGALRAVGVYRMAFEPGNLDHVVAGTVSTGASVSTDGGMSWQRSTGLSSTNGSVNVFNLAFSPVRGRIVWAMGLDIAEADAGAPSQGRHLYLSVDGGMSWRTVVDQDSRVTLINGPLMVPHPEDPGVLYFVFGTYFQGYGTDLYRYDARAGEVTLTHNRYDDIGAIAFHPADPRLMVFGLVNEGGGLAAFR
jgi:hypothetical protein